MSKTPSPCIDVCKFRRAGHCIGCSMTRDQKAMFKALRKTAHRDAFISMLMAQQSVMGAFSAWAPAYLRKCRKKDAPVPSALKSGEKAA